MILKMGEVNMKNLNRALSFIMALVIFVSGFNTNITNVYATESQLAESSISANEIEVRIEEPVLEQEVTGDENHNLAEEAFLEIQQITDGETEIRQNDMVETVSVNEEESYQDFADYNDVLEFEIIEIAEEDIQGEIYNVEDLCEQAEDSMGTMSETYGAYWDQYTSYYVYNRLNPYAKELWSALEVLCSDYLAGEKDFSIAYTDNIRMPIVGWTTDELMGLMTMFRYTHPQYYFLRSSIRYSIGSEYITISFNIYDAFLDGQNRKKATSKINKVLKTWIETINKCDTEEKKIKTIHDLICNKVDYNYAALEGNTFENDQTMFHQSAYSVFCLNKTVCAGYTLAFAWLCNAAGIEAYGVTSLGHAWNKVKVNDNWYNMDCTFNDGGNLNYIHYLRSDANMDVSSHTVEKYWKKYIPSCTLDSGSDYYTAKSVPKITQRVAKPQINVTKTDGTYRIEINSSTNGATIYYTLDGTTPSEAASKSELYKNAFETEEKVLVRAIAVRDKYLDSKVSEGRYEKIKEVRFVTGTEEIIKNAYYEEDNLIVEPMLKDRTGYTFMGWYLSAEIQDESTRWDFQSDVITQDITLYAKWNVNTYTITLDPGKGTLDFKHKNITYDQAYGELPTPIHPGHIFLGWYTEAEEIVTKDTVMKTAKDHTLYARYELCKYRITFDTNGGVTNISEKEVTYSQNYGTLPQPLLSGGRFLGWYTEKSDGVQITEESIVDILEDTTLYAHWEYKYKTAEPVANIPTGSEVLPGTKVILTSDTKGAVIYYTTDPLIGNKITIENSILYEDAIVIEDNMVIYAFAVKAGRLDSDIVTYSYERKDVSKDWGDITPKDRMEMGFSEVSEVPREMWIAGIRDCDYTGKAIIHPDLHIYDHKTLLQPNVDYTVKYKKNINAGTASVIIRGKGNYSGSVERSFIIRPLDLSNAVLQDITLDYNGKIQKGTTTVQYLTEENLLTLKKGKDFTYSYPGTNKKEDGYDSNAFKQEGNYTVTLVGKGNYSGTAYFTQTITTKYVIGKMKFTKIPKQNYTGQEIRPDIELKNGDIPLIYGEDYETEYSDNIEVGTATISIRGIGDYAGTRKVTFSIQGTPLNKVNMEGFVSSLTWKEEPVKQNAAFYYISEAGEKVYLQENVDYISEYTQNEKVGTATVTFTGKGGYTGNIKKKFKITAYDLTGERIHMEAIPRQKYTKNVTTPKPVITYEGENETVILTEGKDYTLKYLNHKTVADRFSSKIPTVVINGKGNFKNKISQTYEISEGDFNDVSIKVGDVIYQKKADICKPVIIITDINGKQLKAGTDYDKNITYSYAEDTVISQMAKKKTTYIERQAGDKVEKNDIIPADTAIIATITGIQNYNGNSSEVFWYVKGDMSKAKIKVEAQIYTGKAVEPDKDDIIVKIGKTVLSKSDYKIVEYSDNYEKGNGKITIAGIGNYGGVKTVTFKIKSKTMSFWFQE